MWGDISWWFWFAFSWFVMLSIFSCTCCILKNFYSGPLPRFLIRLFSCYWVVWVPYIILDINLLSDTWFEKISSHSAGCPFTLSLGFPCCVEGFSLIQSPLSIFACVACTFGVIVKKNLAQPNVKKFFSSRFPVSGMTVKSSIHFGLVFVYRLR